MRYAGRRRRGQRGQTAIFVSLSLVATFGLLGLVVDVGWAMWRREAAQTAAESAVIAAAMAVSSASSFGTCGANGITCQSETACPSDPTTPPGNNLGNACLYAKQNGFVNSGSQTVTVAANTSSPPNGTYAPTYWISVTASERIPQLFSAVLGRPTITVRARGVAGVFQQPTGACIYSLDPSSIGAVTATGNSDIEASCGIYVDSSSGSGLSIGGSTTVNASTIKVVGGYSLGGSGSVNPIPTVNAAYTPDPYGSYSAPSYPNRCDSNTGIPTSGTVTMPADGYYVVCGGGFGMSGNPNVTLAPGIYVLKAGSIDLHNGTLRGTGVTFYLTDSFSGVTINGNVDLNLSAPTSGPTKGLVFYADRAFGSGDLTNKINGGSSTVINGALYFPTTKLEYSGGSNTSATYTAIVAYDIKFTGNSYFAADPNGAHTALGLPKVAFIGN